jgi:DNA-binding PadR family transcriptional regulator
VTLGGCSLLSSPKPQPIEIRSTPVEKPTLTLPNADELNLREVKWVIITADNVEEQIKAIEESGRPVAFFALTDKGYENLGLNLSDLRAYIQQQQAIIAAYKAYYEKAEEALEGAVKEE